MSQLFVVFLHCSIKSNFGFGIKWAKNIISTYLVLTEKQQSEGRADCIIETPTDVFIFEFKLDGTADEALRQIESRGYSRPYSADTRKIHLIGANFSSKTGTIDGWEVR